LRIFSPDALSINLLYNSFWLPSGAKFFIYSEDRKQHIGAFTSRNNKGGKMDNPGFATDLLYTNSIVLEYYEPLDVIENGIISIYKVISGYRSGDKFCILSVACLPDENFSGGKDAVAQIRMGQWYGSGALLNTTKNDYDSPFLTAWHCLTNLPEPIPTEQWIFCWNNETDCDDLKNYSYPLSSTGGEILAKSEITDFMLLRLLEDPATVEDVRLYYLGWDRRIPTLDGVGIHHPKSCPKMISFTTDGTIYDYPYEINWPYGIISPPSTHWLVYFDKDASVYNGSSGSPLILYGEKRIVGQAHGADYSCSDGHYALYGRFDVSWDGSSPETIRTLSTSL
jgi:hypothetical protein